MYLKSLTVKGFKSFARATTFQFEPGVTAVVGPNGSGKSNVVDALAWVMGEQGAKTLRGGKMEDVIFAGTATQGPLSRAHVELTIDNSDGALPIEYSEVQISRTLFRNGGSEYAINGEGARLLDVQELLSDSGLGREMHVIVGQGQLDNVLQATPQDRRGFIEEAAGILKHRRRKEKTLRKLDAMQQNLTRLQDLIGEIRRQLKPLGAQAEIAREAQTVQAEVRDAKAKLYADEVLRLRTTLESASKTESQRKNERLVLQEQLDRAQLRASRIEESMVGDEVDAARKISHALESVRTRLQSLDTLAHQQLALLAEPDAEEQDEDRITQDAVDAALQEARDLAEQVTSAQQEVAAQATTVAKAKASLDALDEEIAQQSALVSKHDLALAAKRSAVEVAESSLLARKNDRERREQAWQNATERLREAREALDSLGDDETEQQDTDALSLAYREADEEAVRLQTELDRLREALHGKERERDSLAARAQALSHALDAKSAASSILEAELPGVDGIVSERISVKKGFEAAVAAALGSLAEAVLVDTRENAIRVAESAAGEDLGRAQLVIAGAPSMLSTAPKTVLKHAYDVCDAPEGIRGLLAFTFIADDLRQAAEAGPELTRLELGGPITIVTRAGEVLTEHTLTGGSGEDTSRIELAADRDEAQHKLDAIAVEIETDAGEVDDVRHALQNAKRSAQDALESLRAHDAESAARGQERSRIRARHESAAAESERAEAALEESASRVTSAEREVERAKREFDEFDRAPRPMLDASARDGMLVELEEARADETELRIRLETARERVRAERDRATSLEREMQAQRARADERARRAVIRSRRRERAERVTRALPAVLSSIDESLSEARLDLAHKETARRQNSEALGKLRQEQTELTERIRELTDRVHDIEMQSYEQKLQLSNLIERSASELGLDEQELLAEYEPGEDFDRDAERARLKDADRKLAKLGRVNPLALEEFAALEQRHTFLNEQLHDLTQTRADLEQIIADLDVTMQDIFATAFEDTKAAFDEVFPKLFPGGRGSLALTDPENLLETGIEVAVRPAGKKIDRLSLLSGGERSLAAVAFMVAIFQARPSPFYIMDEVEAALDDANLGRLLTVFEQLRETSQLIVITHQKRTMEIADVLYGVSMREDGVTQVVGQRTKREEEPA
ncbi:chromosome segregation protein SMC [uncultured Agrococcus sp.]|uniref:chromosome segregation protein SMC n=1 Tax=uncultured Agrococcus sp. TaxID=382258 RepID=UPI0025E74A82|nr:chromosome segregation protein SMC [uncultured Agrococcus sp.]